MRQRKLFYLFFALLFTACITSCSDDENEEIRSSENAILEFTIEGMESVINEAAKTIQISTPYEADLTKLKPAIKVSEGATVVPASGSEIDFTNPVEFTVTAADGSTVKYTATAAFEGKLIPSQYVASDGTVVTFEYDDANRIISLKTVDTVDDYTLFFKYDADGKVSQYDYVEEKITTKFTYKQDTIWAASLFLGESNQTWTTVMVTDKDGIVRKSYTKEYSDTTYVKYDENNQLVKLTREILIGDQKEIYEREFEYDSKTGHASHVNMPHYLSYYMTLEEVYEIFFMSHTYNLTKSTLTEAGQVEFSTYNYNDEVLPTKFEGRYGIDDEFEEMEAVIKYKAAKE